MSSRKSRELCVAALACIGAASVASSAAVAAPREERPATAHESLTLEGRVSVGKPMAPIAVQYEVLAEPQVAQPVQVRITAHPGRGIAELELALSADAPLFVSSVSLSSASPEESVWIAVVTPLEETPGHLNVTVTGLLDGEQQARSLQIPIRVGPNPEGDRAPAVKTDENGARIISLPAQESR
jgi:hypothetical protein